MAGNRLFQSYGNVDGNGHVGLLFFIPGRDHTVRVNGRARPVDQAEVETLQAELSVYWHDDNTKLDRDCSRGRRGLWALPARAEIFQPMGRRNH